PPPQRQRSANRHTGRQQRGRTTLSPHAERMPAESHQPELELQPPGLRRWKNGWILAGQLDRSPRVLGPIDASLLLLAGCSLPGLRPLLLVDALPDVPK